MTFKNLLEDSESEVERLIPVATRDPFVRSPYGPRKPSKDSMLSIEEPKATFEP